MTTPEELARLADAVDRALQPAGEDLVSCVAATARAVFGAVACSIALLTEDGSELVFTTVSGGADDVSGLRIPAGEGIAGWVATTGQPIAAGDLDRDARFAAGIAASTGYVPRAILACPVSTEDRMLGVIEILDRDASRAGADADLELLSLFARQAAMAIDAAERSRRIGALMLSAWADAGSGGLGPALEARVEEDGLQDVAAAFARLAQAGPDERDLAVSVLRDVALYASARGGG